MSADRLLPTEPGWWWVEIYGLTESLHKVEPDNETGRLYVSTTVIGLEEGCPWVDDPRIVWRAPVLTREQAEALTAERDLAQAAVRACGAFLDGMSIFRSEQAPTRGMMIVGPATFDKLKAMFPKAGA